MFWTFCFFILPSMGGMRMRKKVRFLLAGLLVADVLLIGYLMYDYIQNKIPDSVLTYVGEKQELDLPAIFETEQSVPALHVQNQGGGFSMKSNQLGSYQVSVRLFGVLPIKKINVKVVSFTNFGLGPLREVLI